MESNPPPQAAERQHLASTTASAQSYGATDDIRVDRLHPHDGDGDGRGGLLRRGLSARQVQMIAIAGTIGTGLFLGTGKSLAEGGPASLLICYALVGFVVYVTLLLLGEMATQYPIAGSFTTYATLFISPSYGFALAWNYWFNDAVSVASDLTAAQLVLHFWTDSNHYSWLVSLAFFLFLLALNAATVSAYGELEYLLSTLKVLTIIAFTLVGILVNLGLNRHHAPIGLENWTLPGANMGFVDGFAGFAKVFVTASFAYGGTESLGITAGETRNPSKNMPRVVKFVFWRILLFYVFSVLIIGLNVPYSYPNLSNRSTTTSPFTIVFYESGSNIAASFMNTVILTSVLSAGNHAMFAGTRVLYGLSSSNPPLAPALFSRTTKHGVPIPALLATSSISILCFASSFVGSGVLWGWLQNVVGVSNQIAWLSIGLASLRFRRAWILQGRPLSEMKFRAGWTWGWGPPFVIVTVSAFILIQGYSSLLPTFSPIDFLSFYIELPVMALMYALYLVLSCQRNSKHTTGRVPFSEYDEDGDRNRIDEQTPIVRRTFSDLVDIRAVDLTLYEYAEGADDVADDERREANLRGRWGWAWRVWYFVA